MLTNIDIETLKTHQNCSPETHILFLKTHKTGSSTISNIFFRYGDSRGLQFILGSDTLVGWPSPFRISHTLHPNGFQPNFLCSHTRFSKKTMNYLFPKDRSKYITILRHPVDQFESVFNYMGFGEVYNLGSDATESIKGFLRKGIEFKDIFRARSSVLARNPMMFDLGLDYKFYQNASAVKDYIAFLEKEFDLVMITEYFEESVVLMKRLLCWSFIDILHIKTNERIAQERAEFSGNLRENIKRWNKADMLLYDHFNKTFWYKIEMEGKEFYEDLATFRRLKEVLHKNCFGEAAVVEVYPGKYAKTLSLNPNVSGVSREVCKKLIVKENSYLSYLRQKQLYKSPGPIDTTIIEADQPNISWSVSKDFQYDPLPI